MSLGDAGHVRALLEAERDVAIADHAVRSGLDLLKVHAGRPGSYSAPLAALGALVVFRLARRAWRGGPRHAAMKAAAAAAPASAGLAAVLLRLALPGTLRLARERARGWWVSGEGRSGAGGAAGSASGTRAMPRVSASLDRARFAGRWFELASLHEASGTGDGGATSGPASLVLVPRPGGQADGFDVERTPAAKGAPVGTRVRPRSGVLRPAGPAGPASELSLSFAPSWSRWLPMAWHDFWVLEVDVDYTFALVGDRARTSLAVLARTPSLDEAAWRQLLATATEEGYPVGRLVRADAGRS
jgi:apolipoprotein D and lipocalin family protein